MRLLLARKLIGVSSAAEPLPAQRRRRPCLSEMHSQQNQMRCIRRRRPSASAMRDRSSWSLVTTRSSRARAPTTTEASITSGVEARAHAFPDARDRASLRSSMRQPRRRRDSGALGTASPRLPEHPGRHDGSLAAREGASMQSPRVTAVRLSGKKRSGIVREAHATLDRWRAPPDRSSIASAAANSSSVSAPCSASHSATAANPSSIAKACSAARVSQADKLSPWRSALAAAAAATCSSSEIESFWTPMRGIVTPQSYRKRVELRGQLSNPRVRQALAWLHRLVKGYR